MHANVYIPNVILTGSAIFPQLTDVPKHATSVAIGASMQYVQVTARVLISQAEAIVHTGKTWPQATKRRN